MTFKKADPQQAALKVSAYGPQGSGKTMTSLLVAEGIAKRTKKRIAYVDTERGTDFYAKEIPERKIHPKAFDFDALYTRSLADVINSCHSLDPKEHSVVVIDSISHLWDSAIDAYAGNKTKIGSIPMYAWSRIKKPYKDLLKWLIESPFHVFILGRQKNLFDNVIDEEKNEEKLIKVGVGMRAEGETQFEPHICLRLESEQIQLKKQATISNIYCYVEKDRSGILHGKILENPSYKNFEPILDVLGVKQAKLDDEDERIAADSELLDKQDEAKYEKSQKQFFELQEKLFAARDGKALSEVSDLIRKKKRYMSEEHVSALRQAFKDVSARF